MKNERISRDSGFDVVVAVVGKLLAERDWGRFGFRRKTTTYLLIDGC